MQAHAQIRLAHPATGIDAGAKGKAEVRADGRALQPARIDQRRQADILAAGEDLEALRDKGAVEAAQLGDIGDRAERHNIEQLEQFRFGAIFEIALVAQCPDQRRTEQKGHADGGEMAMFGPRIAFVEPVGVDQRDRFRQLGGAFVMVDHDHLDPGSVGHVERLEGHRAAVDGDHQIAALPAQLDQGLSRRAIALHQPVGNIIAGLQTQIPEQADHQRRAGRAVDIIIAEDRHLFLFPDRVAQPIRCRIHVTKDGRIGHEASNRRLAVDRQRVPAGAAGEQQLGDQIIGLEARIARIGAGAAPAPALAGQRFLDIQYCVHGLRYASKRWR